MKTETNGELDLGTASTEEITEAMARGIRAALEEHKQAGRSVVVWDWDHQRVATVPLERIEVPGLSNTITSHRTGPVKPPTTREPDAPTPHHS